MLISARYFQKCKVCTMSFLTHNLWSILDKKWWRNRIFKYDIVLHFFIKSWNLQLNCHFNCKFHDFMKKWNTISYLRIRFLHHFLSKTLQRLCVKKLLVHTYIFAINEHLWAFIEHLRALPTTWKIWIFDFVRFL